MTWLCRQSFLGPNSDRTLNRATVGIVGLGGGGSHVAQQLAHVGIGHFVLIDPDVIEDHNLNRLVGGTLRTARRAISKVRIARDLIKGVQPGASVTMLKQQWQMSLAELRACDVIIGAVDKFIEREELERFCRQNLIPYIDMGMDVSKTGAGYLVAGQVLLSMPGEPCLRCVGVVTDDRIKQEAERYGDAGPRPQVIWPNGVLASTSVGFLVQLLTPWFEGVPYSAYREYDANTNTMRESPKWEILLSRSCPHHPAQDRGDPTFDIRVWLEQPVNEEQSVSLVDRLIQGLAKMRGWLAR